MGTDEQRRWVTVNGERREHPAELPLADFLSALGHDARAVAVELNGRVLKRAEHGDTRVAPGDRIEIVRFVQGGSSHRPSRRV